MSVDTPPPRHETTKQQHQQLRASDETKHDDDASNEPLLCCGNKGKNIDDITRSMMESDSPPSSNDRKRKENDISDPEQHNAMTTHRRPYKKRSTTTLQDSDMTYALPMTLQTVLVDEWQAITQQQLLHQLPASVTIHKVLEHYVKTTTTTTNSSNSKEADANKAIVTAKDDAENYMEDANRAKTDLESSSDQDCCQQLRELFQRLPFDWRPLLTFRPVK
jgi:hypothetical protein